MFILLLLFLCLHFHISAALLCTRPTVHVGYVPADDNPNEELDTSLTFSGGTWSCDFRNGYKLTSDSTPISFGECTVTGNPYTVSGCSLSTDEYTCGTRAGIFALTTKLECGNFQMGSLAGDLTIIGNQPSPPVSESNGAEIAGNLPAAKNKRFLTTLAGNDFALTLKHLIFSGWQKGNPTNGIYGSGFNLNSNRQAIFVHVWFVNNGGRGGDLEGSAVTGENCSPCKCLNGGAINAGVSSNIIIQDSTFQSNSCLGAPGATVSKTKSSSDSNVYLDETTGDGLGGALRCRGTTKIERTKFIENKARSGGAVSNDGLITIVDSTFKSNTATGTFQASANDGGGALYNKGQMTVRNSAFESK